MIANPAIPHPYTLNDVRVHSSIAEEPSSTSALTVSGLAVAALLAIGMFIWLDPLRLLTPIEESPPTRAIVPSAEPARPTERQAIIAPLTPVPATKSIEVPIATAPAIQASHIPAPAARPRAAGNKPNLDKTNTTVLETSPKEMTAPPVLLSKPEQEMAPPVPVIKTEQATDAPIVPKLGDDIKNEPKPGAANGQAPVTE